MEAEEAMRVRDAKRVKGTRRTREGAAARQRPTVFDDVYRTMVQKMPELMIPLINEVFHTNYPEDIEKAQLRNEHLEIQKKLITDSILNIAGNTYHIECQSTPDGQMALRMFEYGAAIALENAHRQHPADIVPPRVRFPFAAVLYLRSAEQTPDALTVIINLPDGREIPYHVPLIKVQAFSLDEIFQKRLFLFLPFYILRYEKDCAAIEQDEVRLGKLLDEYKRMSDVLPSEMIQCNDRCKAVRLLGRWVFRRWLPFGGLLFCLDADDSRAAGVHTLLTMNTLLTIAWGIVKRVWAIVNRVSLFGYSVSHGEIKGLVKSPLWS